MTKGQVLDPSAMKEQYDVNEDDVRTTTTPNQYDILLTWAAHQKMLSSGLAESITPDIIDIDPQNPVFPFVAGSSWALDNYGPIWIPAAGATLTLTPDNYPIYERAIRVYEGNNFEMRQGKFYLNGQPVTPI